MDGHTAKRWGARTGALLFLILILIQFTGTATASGNISFSDLNFIGCQFDVYDIYNGENTYIGTYNSTSVIPYVDGHNYQYVLKGSAPRAILTSPEGLFNFFNENRDSLLAMMIVVGIGIGIGAIVTWGRR